MSNKTTMILTFIVSVVVPFIQEVVDLVEALKGKSYNTATAKKISSDFQTDVAQAITVANKDSDKKTSGSRFFSDWRNK